MHFDLIHALAVAAALVLTRFILIGTGIVTDEEARKFNWKFFAAFTLVVFVLNMVWPY